ncbi:MAG: nucleotidyltransferase family protein [bacterium]|nr:nucleotidyltransferase family protein [bacterium]
MQQAVFEDLKSNIVPILKMANIKKAALFGSYVRGENTKNSDVDILIEYPPNTSLFDVAELKYLLEEKLKKPIDLVNYTSIKPQLKDFILTEQVPIL